MEVPEGTLSEFSIRAHLQFKDEAHILDAPSKSAIGNRTSLNVLRCNKRSDVEYVKQGTHDSIVRKLETLTEDEQRMAK